MRFCSGGRAASWQGAYSLLWWAACSKNANSQVSDWRDIYTAKVFGKIMHRVTSCFLLCRELGRNSNFIDLYMRSTESIFMNGIALTLIPLGPFRKIGSWIGSFRHGRLDSALQVLLPFVTQRFATRSSSSMPASPLNALEWTIELTEGTSEQFNARRIALYLLHNLWAGSSATGGLLT